MTDWIPFFMGNLDAVKELQQLCKEYDVATVTMPPPGGGGG